jgi:squalene synthase HpnC
VYAFCRWADDLGDEIGDPEESLRLLAWWRWELERMFTGNASHPVYVALQQTVERRRLPRQPFDDLITAFEQDQRVNRYETFDALYGYCRCSANPVGRLVLHLCGYFESELLGFSDATCTALQLANFWQDVAVDLEKNRLYIPLELLRRHGCPEEDILARRFTPQFAAVMREAVARTRELFDHGLPLARRVDRRLALDIELFSRGGLLILRKIERQNYDVLSRRPAISKTERFALLLRTLAKWAFARPA